jgi:medium-chain acyl-[acyl-carrier-protein] hydrolase
VATSDAFRGGRPGDPSVTAIPGRAASDFRLICLPPAGGASAAFRHWRALLPETFELCLVELPGHGTRLLEQPFTDFDELVAATARSLTNLRPLPYALLGHSLGGIIAYEAALHLAALDRPQPAHLVTACCPAPHLPTSIPHFYELPSDELRIELRRLGGTPAEVLDNDELWELLEPSIRADLSFAARYRPQECRPVDYPITAVGGRTDAFVMPADIEAWRPYTKATFTTYLLEGAHFALHDQRQEFLAELVPTLAPTVPADRLELGALPLA